MKHPAKYEFSIPVTFFLTFKKQCHVCVCLFLARQPASGPGPPRLRGLLFTHNDAPQSVGLLWTSDQLVAETST